MSFSTTKDFYAFYALIKTKFYLEISFNRKCVLIYFKEIET